jgi:hypothetical protein
MGPTGPSSSSSGTGPTGEMGPTGSSSLGTGPTGATGETGETGVTGPTGPAGSSSGSGLAGVTTLSTTSLANGAQITSDNYLQLGPADSSNPGLVTTDSQTFTGSKTFNYDLTVNGLTIGLGGSSISTNTAIGINALDSNTTGSQNTAVGYQAGYAGTANTTGSYNTYIGYKTQASGNHSNSTAIGYNATITGNNQIVIGTTSETVRYNKVYPLYTSVPYFDSTDIGYIVADINSNTILSTSETEYLNVTVTNTGLYLVTVIIVFTVNQNSTVTTKLKVAGVNNVQTSNYIQSSRSCTVTFTTPIRIGSTSEEVSLTGQLDSGSGSGTVGNTFPTGTMNVVRIA